MLLRKGVYPYEYMDSWEKFDETALPPKNDFYSILNLEDISDEDYAHAQILWDVFEIKNLGEYHDLYVQSDTFLLADVSENFRNMCLNIYEIDPVYFVSAPGLAWQPCLKKTGAKLELITYYDMILLIEKVLGIENYKIRLIHVFILFLTFRPLLKVLSSYCKYFFTNRIFLKIMQLSVIQFYR